MDFLDHVNTLLDVHSSFPGVELQAASNPNMYQTIVKSATFAPHDLLPAQQGHVLARKPSASRREGSQFQHEAGAKLITMST